MTTTVLAPYQKNRFFDNAGNPLYLGQLTTFQAGTNTPITTYKDSTGTVNTNPIILNSRGECDLWLLPNVAYKFALTDSAGTTIPGWPIDNIVSSQLITLYGGVDTGSTNAYVLNFTGNFTSYSDGIVIIWIPNNTNTGASTINVNGLGIVSIVNPDGSALINNEIIANQPAQILFKGGVFQLLTAATTVYGQFTCSWVGFSVAPANTTIQYRKNGSLVTLRFPGGNTGTSNSTVFIMGGLPSILTPTVNSLLGLVPVMGLMDNGAVLTGGGSATAFSGNTMQFWKDATGTANWTAAAAKGFNNQSIVTYSL